MSFAVVAPSRTVSNLLPCVERVFIHEPHLPAENVIIVDDGIEWTDEARDLTIHCTVIPNERPDGKFVFSRAVNLGIRKALEMGVDGVVILNDDALLESPGGFSLLAETCRQHSELGLIGAVTNLTGQPLQRQYFGDQMRIVPDIAFICVYIPRSTIDRVGMMDERYCVDYGCCDRDMCEAVTRAGLKVAVHDGCFVDHSSLVSTFRGDPRTPRSFQENYKLLLQKWGTLTTN